MADTKLSAETLVSALAANHKIYVVTDTGLAPDSNAARFSQVATFLTNGLTEETGVDGAADFIPIYDTSEAAANKALPTNLKRAGGLQLLTSGTAAAVATLDIVLTSYTGYRGLKIFLSGLQPVTDGAHIYMRFSTDGGSTYDAGASDYNYSNLLALDDGTSAVVASAAAAQIQMISNTGNASTECVNLEITLLNQTNTAFFCRAMWTAFNTNSFGNGAAYIGGGSREVAQDTDAVRFLFSTGNIGACNYAVYGLI